MLTLFKCLVWFVISTGIELVASLIIAGFAVFFFNLAGVAVLSGLTYWNLYWIQMAVYEMITSPVVMGLVAYEFMQD